jgi:hypothetical protein
MNKTEYTCRLELALWELVHRWPGEHEYDVAVERARQLLLEAPSTGPDDATCSNAAGSVGEQAPV